MKKIVSMLLVLALAALAVAALAEAYTQYINADKTKVYAKTNTDSKVLAKLPRGQEVLVEKQNKNGKWSCIHYDEEDDTKLGWVPTKYLQDTPPCDHQWSEWETRTEPTCTKAGVQARTCATCGEEQTKEIKKLGHSFSKWTVSKEPTCTKDGEKTRTCATCGKVSTKTVDKTGHDWGKWKVTKEPTCTKEGEKVRTCKACKKEQKKAVEKVEHTYGKWKVTKEPTCTKEGEKVRTCKVCKKEQKKAVEKTAHPFGDWQVTRAATCTAQGEQTRKCKTCDKEEKRALDIIPHSYGAWETTLEATDHSSGTRTRTCQSCGATQTQDYDPDGTLRRGSLGDDVLAVQQLLADQGYLGAGGVDGAFGGGTERALIMFQTAQGLNPDGVAWPQTIKRLSHEFGEWELVTAPTRAADGERRRVCAECGFEQRESIATPALLERGRRGEDVRTVQRLLNGLGFECGSEDGIYGQKLDNAFTAFAASKGLTFEPGRVMPADMDALLNAWIAARPQGAWKGQGGAGAAVSLSLTVTPAAEQPEDGSHIFDWQLTNQGAEPCRFTALLLGFGDTHDFRQEDLAAAIDGADLEPGAAAVSGSFTVRKDWGEGPMHFCALAVQPESGDVWTSNVWTYDLDR